MVSSSSSAYLVRSEIEQGAALIVLCRRHIVRLEERDDKAAGLTSPLVRRNLRENLKRALGADRTRIAAVAAFRNQGRVSLGSVGGGVENRGNAYGGGEERAATFMAEGVGE